MTGRLLLVLSITIVAVLAVQPTAQAATTTISGNVTDDLGLPLPSIEVSLCTSPSTCPHTTTTDSSGDYSFDVDGIFRLYVEDPAGDHYDEWWDDAPGYTDGTLIDATVGGTITADVELRRVSTVQGTVTDADDGAPISGLDVLACLEGPSFTTCSPTPTAADGTYSIELERDSTYYLRFDGDIGAEGDNEYLDEYWDDQPTSNTATRIDTSVTVSTTADAAMQAIPYIAGTVRDQEGNPIEGVSVSASGANTGLNRSDTTDAAGNYSLQVAVDDWTLRFNASFPEYLSEWWQDATDVGSATPVAITSGGTTTIDPVLTRRAQVSGTVSLSDSAGFVSAIGVDYCPVGGGDCESTTTGSDGTYSQWIPPGDYTVYFDGSSRQYTSEYYDDVTDIGSATEVTATLGSPLTGIDAVLRASGTVSGTVTGTDGFPAVGLTVQLCWNSGSNCGTEQTTTDANGDYTMTREPFFQSAYRVKVLPEGEYLGAEVADQVIAAGVDLTGVDFTLDMLGSLSGTVVDTTAAPIQGVTVTLWGSQIPLSTLETTTAADGTYSFADLKPADDYRVQFESAQFVDEWYDDGSSFGTATAITVPSNGDVTGIDAELDGGGFISGTVTDVTTGLPIEGARINAFNSSGGDGTTTAADGTYTLYLTDGTYSLQFLGAALDLSDYMDDTWPTDFVITTSSAFTDIDVALTPWASISGTVTDSDGGAPLADIKLYRCDADGTSCTTRSNWRTAADGTYTLDRNGAGSYIVQFDDETDTYGDEFYDNASTTDDAQVIVLTAGQHETGIDAALSSGGTIAGRVTNDSGTGIAGAEVIVAQDGGPPNSTQFLSTNSEGYYVVTGLAPGSYRVTFVADGYFTETYDDAPTGFTPVVVANGVITSGIDAELDASGFISGTVTDTLGNPLGAIRVSACAGSACFNRSTNFDGTFKLTQLAEGDYTLRIADLFLDTWAAEYWDNQIDEDAADTISVVAGSPVTGLEIELAEKGSLAGTITGPVGPIDGAVVSACRSTTAGDCYVTITDALGDYEFDDVLPATYRVQAEPPPAGLAPEYWNNAFSFESSDPVTVPAGGSVVDIDITLGPAGQAFVSTDPGRFADTRTNGNTIDDLFEGDGANPAGNSYEVQIAGRGDIPVDATAAIINLTTVLADAPGHATVYPCTDDVPKSSAANYNAGGVDPNEVIAKLSPTGTVCVYTHATVHLLLDVVGYTKPTSPYVAIDPARYADSRPKTTIDGQFANTGPVAAGTSWKIQIAGRGDIPATATTAVLNVTAVVPDAAGHLTIYPCTAKVPTASSLNYTAGMVRPNEVVAKLSDTGEVCIYSHANSHVLVDAVGYIDPTPGFTSTNPSRFADSRPKPTIDNQYSNRGPNPAGTTWEIQIAGRGAVPADATTAVLNITVVLPDAAGHATVYPCTAKVPTASSLNYNPGDVRANELITKLSPTGTICIYTVATTHLLVDVTGHNGTP